MKSYMGMVLLSVGLSACTSIECRECGTPLVFTGEQNQGVKVMAPAGREQSFACWVKVEGCGKGDKPYDRIVQAPAWYLHIVAAPDEVPGMTFGYTDRQGKIIGHGDFGTILFGTWQHVAVTYSAEGYRVFLNGICAGAWNDGLPDALPAGHACLANASIGGMRPFKGLIMDARFWSRALTKDEVARLAERTPDGTPVKRPKLALPTDDDLLPVVDISGEAARQVVIAEARRTATRDIRRRSSRMTARRCSACGRRDTEAPADRWRVRTTAARRGCGWTVSCRRSTPARIVTARPCRR